MKASLPLLLIMTGLLLAPSLQANETSASEPGSQAVYLQLIQRMQQQGAWYASLAHIDALRQQYGDSPALQLAQADAMRRTEQPLKARLLYEQLLRGPHKAAALNGLGLIEAQQGNLPAAIEKFRQAANLSPLNVGYLGDLGFALLLSGDLEGARLPLAQAVELAPSDGRSVANAAIWQLLAGKETEANAMQESARLPESIRQQVQATAQRLRLSRHAGQTDPAIASPPQIVTDVVTSRTTSPNPPLPTASDARVTAPTENNEEAKPLFLPRAPMLEHFANSSTQQGSQP